MHGDARAAIPLGHMDRVFDRLLARGCASTNLAHVAGYNKLEDFALKMTWQWPYIPMDDPLGGLLRLLAFIDWIAYDEEMDSSSVSQTFSNAKSYFLEHIPLWFNTLSPGPWQDKGVHHPLISLALKHLPKKDKKKRFAIPREWIRTERL
jgi:hypothetical protein